MESLGAGFHLLRHPWKATYCVRPFFFQPQKSLIVGLFDRAISKQWTKRVGHFFPGGSGTARELAKSKPELVHALTFFLVTRSFKAWRRSVFIGVVLDRGVG